MDDGPSASLQSYLSSMGIAGAASDPQDPARQGGSRLPPGPTIVDLGPAEPEIEEVTALLDEGDGRMARIHRRLARHRGGWGFNAEGRWTYSGRVCCAEALHSLVNRFHVLTYPHDCSCPVCGHRFQARYALLGVERGQEVEQPPERVQRWRRPDQG